MNRTAILLCISLLLLTERVVLAAPVGNMYDPAVWKKRHLATPLALMLTVEYDIQDNTLPEQIRRFTWSDPDTVPEEVRHYHQTRSSRNKMSGYGARLGRPITDHLMIYGLIGKCEAEIDFHYEDWTIGRLFESDDTFEFEPDLYYGGGVTFLLHRDDDNTRFPYAIGMDLQYRRYNFEKDKLKKQQRTAYECTLDEIQLAFSLSIQKDWYSPYAGVKVASLTGQETYINRNYDSDYYEEGYIHYEDDITWSKNIGYFIGINALLFNRISLGMELRSGDEEGVGISATTLF